MLEVSVQLRLSFVKGGPSWRPRSTTHVRRCFLSFWFLSLLMISLATECRQLVKLFPRKCLADQLELHGGVHAKNKATTSTVTTTVALPGFPLQCCSGSLTSVDLLS